MNTSHETFLPVVEFAKARDVTTRTVNNWLAADRLPGARKDGAGKWMIPADVELGPPASARSSAAVVVLPSAAPAPVVPLPVPDAVPARRPFAPKRRPIPIADVAAEFGVPVATVRRWAKAGEGGLSLSSGEHGAHYVWIEAAG